jgi:peptidoglycan biosynthesis protein MviN/MurJ (putative lipid II flippase)
MGGIAATVVDRYLLGHGDARGAFRLEALNTVVALLVLLPAVMAVGLHGAAASWMLGGLSTFVFSLWLIRKRIPGALSESWGRLGASVVVALAAAAIAGWVATHLTGLPALVAGGLAGVASGALVLWWQNAALGLRLTEFIPLLSKRNDDAG